MKKVKMKGTITESVAAFAYGIHLYFHIHIFVFLNEPCCLLAHERERRYVHIYTETTPFNT